VKEQGIITQKKNQTPKPNLNAGICGSTLIRALGIADLEPGATLAGAAGTLVAAGGAVSYGLEAVTSTKPGSQPAPCSCRKRGRRLGIAPLVLQGRC